MQLLNSVLSPAKLNLGLKIIGKKLNGYHLINSVLCLIDLYDTIDIQVSNQPLIQLIDHQQSWLEAHDLAFRAATLLQHTMQIQLGANIKIKKKIPIGAGLGGGSSNAATVLVVLNRLWGLNLNLHQLMDLGCRLGADVPFFIHGHNAYVTGIGEQCTRIDIPLQYFVIVKPDFSLSTKDIFSHVLLLPNNKNQYNPSELIASLDNDLQNIAIGLKPELAHILQDLSIFGKPTMTGSGSAIFIQFQDFTNANKVALNLKTRYNTFLVKSLAVSPILHI